MRTDSIMREAATSLRGALAEDAKVTVDGEMVTVAPRRVGPAANTSGTPRRCRAARPF